MTLRHRPPALLLALLVFAAMAPAPAASAWEPVPPPAGDVAWVERDPALPAGVFAATADGLFHSPDAGESWRRLDARRFDLLAASPASSKRLYAVTREDTFVFAVERSDDGGETFAPVSPLVGGGFGGRLLDFAVAPGDADLLFASLRTRPGELATTFSSDVWRSTDGGTSWSSIRWFPAEHDEGGKLVFDLEVAATDSRRVYAATEDGLDRSDDGGATWRTARGGPWIDVAVDPLDADHLLGLTATVHADLGGLWESHDGGDSWVPVAVTVTVPGLPGPFPLHEVFFDPVDRTSIGVVASVAEGRRILASRDGGATWETVDGPYAAPAVLPASGTPLSPPAILPTAPRRLLVVADRELLRSSLDLPLCPDRPTALCLDGGRFLVEVAWQDFQGGRGSGLAAPLTADAGTFWFFEPDNVELAVKVLDARAVNGHWWVFFGALTNVRFDLRVMDLASGRSRLYHNPSGRFASQGDTAAFAAPAAASTAPAPPPAWVLMLPAEGADLAGACVPDGTALCLLDRFRVTVDWQDPTGHGGPGNARPLTSETGWFWFFDADNPELFVKVLDGRTVNGHWWVFFGSLTDVRFDLLVEDTIAGGSATYHHASGTFASHGDTTALP